MGTFLNFGGGDTFFPSGYKLKMTSRGDVFGSWENSIVLSVQDTFINKYHEISYRGKIIFSVDSEAVNGQVNWIKSFNLPYLDLAGFHNYDWELMKSLTKSSYTLKNADIIPRIWLEKV